MSTEKTNSIVGKKIAKTAHDMVRRHCAEFGSDTETDIAHALGMAASSLNNQLNAHHPIKAEVVIGLTRILKDPSILHEMAAMCDGIFVSVPPMRSGSLGEVLKAAEKALREDAEVSQRIFGALADGEIDSVEAEQIEREIMESIRAKDALLRRVKLLVRR